MGGRIDTHRNHRFGGRLASPLAGAIVWGFAALGAGLGTDGLRAADTGAAKPSREELTRGRDLFEREWLPNDSRTHGGDGLGPVYNDSSCIACHNLGGAGGGGPASKNVDIISASPNGQMQQFPVQSPPEPGFLGKALGSLVGLDAPDARKTKRGSNTPLAAAPTRRKVDTGPLVQAHPGFRTARSVVLHHFSTDSGYEAWRHSMLGIGGMVPPGGDPASMAMMHAQQAVVMAAQLQFAQNNIGEFALVHSQRNPTALYGSGLIDSIPDAAIEEAAKARHAGFREISGRVSRLKDKQIGRFGWKAQTASLSDFVLTACAVELGLEVPGHHQAGNPRKPDAVAKGLDLTAQECDSLVAYIRELPRPLERRPATEAESKETTAGRTLFASIGCATCHTPKLGGVDGIYSDLLLHDMGPQLGDTGQYGVFDPSSSEEPFSDEEVPIAATGITATAIEVREPVMLSAPTRLAFAMALANPQPAVPAEATPVETVAPPVPPGAIAATPAAPVGAVVVQEAQAADVVVSATTPAPPMAGMMQFMMAGQVMAKRPISGPASRFEWRTPPLWGFRDSGPYLHDGRAATLEQAVALHGGEAAGIAQRFFSLKPVERLKIEAFLKSLAAPDQAGPAQLASAR
jgi:CxxC motif-containing protein (DUF1111 family)